MASTPILIPLLLVVATLSIPLFSSPQVHARESQLFSKVTNNNDDDAITDQSILDNIKQEEHDPAQTASYGHDSQDSSNKYPQVRYDDDNNNNNDNQYNNIEDLRMSERDGYAYTTRNSMNQFYNNRNGYGYDRSRRQDHNMNSYMPNYNNYEENRYSGQQGMSDTRFMENGKYYYDLDREAQDPNGYQNWRAVALSNNLQQYQKVDDTDGDDRYVP